MSASVFKWAAASHRVVRARRMAIPLVEPARERVGLVDLDDAECIL
jgi:hypothetical protein